MFLLLGRVLAIYAKDHMGTWGNVSRMWKEEPALHLEGSSSRTIEEAQVIAREADRRQNEWSRDYGMEVLYVDLNAVLNKEVIPFGELMRELVWIGFIPKDFAVNFVNNRDVFERLISSSERFRRRYKDVGSPEYETYHRDGQPIDIVRPIFKVECRSALGSRGATARTPGNTSLKSERHSALGQRPESKALSPDGKKRAQKRNFMVQRGGDHHTQDVSELWLMVAVKMTGHLRFTTSLTDQ